MYEIPKDAICVNCKKRPATIRWIGEGSTTDVMHGAGVPWCEVCSIEAQLEYVHKQAARIPELEARLKELKSELRGDKK